MGNFHWYDNKTADVEGVRDFYCALFGWTFSAMDTPSGPYTMLLHGGVPFGGLVEADDAPPHWIAYATVADLDAAVAAIERTGGRLTADVVEAGDIGRIAFFVDPEHAALAAFQTPSKKPAPPERVGSFGWMELQTADVPAAIGFYTSLFGWGATEPMRMPDGSTYTMLLERSADPSSALAGVTQRPAGMPVSAWTPYISVADADAVVARAVALGAKLVHPPTTVPDMVSFAVLADPGGAVFGVAKSLAGE